MERYPRRRVLEQKNQKKIPVKFEKKVFNQLVLCAFLIGIVMLGKGVSVSGGVVGDYAKKVLNHTTDLTQTSKDFMNYAEQSGLLPEWVFSKGGTQGNTQPTSTPNTQSTPQPNA